MINQSYYMLLLSEGTETEELKMLLTNAKISFVKKHHDKAISKMTCAKGYKKDKWKTYITLSNGKRKEIIRRTEEEIYEALFDYYSSLETKAKTIEQVFERLKDYKLNSLARSQHTIDEDVRRFNILSDALKTKALSDISDEDIRTWLVKDFLKTSPKLSSFRKQLQLLNQIFDFGIRNKICFENPIKYISANDYIHLCDTAQKPDEEREFSKDEIQVIKEDCLKDVADPFSLMTLVSIETGQRAGELPALLKSDLLDEYLHVHRQQLKGKDESGHQIFYDVEYTKDERWHPHDGRFIPITSECREYLNLTKTLSGESKYIFHDKNGNPIQRDSYVQNLRRRCQRLNIECTHNHGFRIAFNSRLIELGINSADRALILGHEVQTNETHYSITDKLRLADIRNKLTENGLDTKH